MTAVLQWTSLAVCLGCTMFRLPALVQGRNRSLFWAFALVTLSVALSIPALYLPIDGALGGANAANVLLRLCLFATFFLLAAKVAAAYSAPRALALIRGPVGLAVLLVCSAGILATYLNSDVRGSSPGLSGYFGQPSVVAYMWIGKLYLAYVAACLIAPTGRAAFSRRPRLDRAAALSMCLGFSFVCAALVVQTSPWHQAAVMGVLSFGSVLLVAAGLAMVWVSYWRRPRKQ